MKLSQIRTLSFVLSSAATLMAGQTRSLEDLTRESPLIVLGRVTSADSYTAADGEVYTSVLISPESVLKDAGNAATNELRFTVKGGVIGDRVVYFSDAPRFAAGEDVVLFAGGAGGAVEKFRIDPVHGQEILLRIEQTREDSGEAVPEEQKSRARQFLRNPGRGGGGREPDAELILNAATVSCSAYMGPKWASPATTYSVGANLPSTWSPVLQSAAQSWNGAGSRFAFTLNPSSPHTIALGDLGSGPTLASTRVEYYQTTRELVRFTMTFNNRYTWTTTGEAGKMDVQSIATHELGHALGLDHPGDSSCLEQTMWATAGAGETKKRSLELGDKTGVATLYGTAVSGGTTPPPPPPPPPPAPATPVVSNFALVTTRAVATKPTVILFQGTAFDPAKAQAFFTGGPCGTGGCVATPYAASETNIVLVNTLPAGTYSVAIRNGPTGTLSAPRSFTVNAN